MSYISRASNFDLNLSFLLCVCYAVSVSALYDVGQTYNYNYATTLKLDEPDKTRSKDVTYQVVADVAATTVWQNPSSASETLLLLQVNNPKLMVAPKNGKHGELSGHTSSLDKYTADKNIVLHMKEGSIVELFDKETKSPFFYIKAGIASLFQFQTQNTEIEEVDTSGKCKVTYKVSGDAIQKTKRNCVSLLTPHLKSHPNKVLGTELLSESLTTYRMDKDHTISSLYSLESHIFRINVIKNTGALVQSVQKLGLVGKEDGTKKIAQGKTLHEALIQLKKLTGLTLKSSGFNVKKAAAGSKCKNLPDLIRDKQTGLKTSNLAKLNSVSTFLDVMQQARECGKDVLVKILKSAKNKAILPQLLDIVAACQTPASFQSVFEILNFESKSIDLPERFLTALSVIPHPEADVLRRLLELAKQGSNSEKLQETLLLTLGSLAKTYFRQRGNDQVTIDIRSWLTEQLQKCKDDNCKVLYLRAVKHIPLPETISVILDVIKQGGKAVTAALKVLEALHHKNAVLSEEVDIILNQVYYQLIMKQDTTSRIAAAQILLETNPSLDVIRNIILSLANTASVEVNTYILSKIKETMKHDAGFRQKIREVLRNPAIGNYNILAQKGTSTVFTNSFFENSNFNATYGLQMEMIPGGLLKHSEFHVGLNYQGEDLPILSFGLFAGGLGGLANEETSNAGENEDAMTAGIQLGVLDSYMRPYTFFTGQGELMGLVWSGTGSETTPILQGNYLLHDHQQSVVLQNGITLDITLFGAMSYDLSGSIQISLWNRNSQSLVSNKVALVIKSVVSLESDFIQTQVGITTAAEGFLDFNTDLEFYESPFKMCTQMIQSPVSFKRIISKTERIPGSKHRIRRTRRVASRIPGKSFALHRKNSMFCSVMLNQK